MLHKKTFLIIYIKWILFRHSSNVKCYFINYSRINLISARLSSNNRYKFCFQLCRFSYLSKPVDKVFFFCFRVITSLYLFPFLIIPRRMSLIIGCLIKFSDAPLIQFSFLSPFTYERITFHIAYPIQEINPCHSFSKLSQMKPVLPVFNDK